MYCDARRLYYTLILHNLANKPYLIDTTYRCTNNKLVYQHVEYHMADKYSFFEELLIGRYVPLDILYLFYLFYGSRFHIDHQYSSNIFLGIATHLSFILLPRCCKFHLQLCRCASLAISSRTINTTERMYLPLLILGK